MRPCGCSSWDPQRPPRTPAARAQGLDLVDDGDIREIELEAGERRKAYEDELRKIPPEVVGFWNFDKEREDLKTLPGGWWVGIWGDRKAYYGTGGLWRHRALDEG